MRDNKLSCKCALQIWHSTPLGNFHWENMRALGIRQASIGTPGFTLQGSGQWGRIPPPGNLGRAQSPVCVDGTVASIDPWKSETGGCNSAAAALRFSTLLIGEYFMGSIISAFNTLLWSPRLCISGMRPTMSYGPDIPMNLFQEIKKVFSALRIHGLFRVQAPPQRPLISIIFLSLPISTPKGPQPASRRASLRHRCSNP